MASIIIIIIIIHGLEGLSGGVTVHAVGGQAGQGITRWVVLSFT